jgi:predicted RNase H-like nuclease
VNFVGVDLAWGERARTGLCVSAGGRVTASTTCRTMDDIAGWIRRYSSSDCLVAIDAPLIVRNPTGRRRCEAEISRCFGRHEAGTHPSNLAKSCFAGGGRARQLALRLGLSTDPRFGPREPVRRAIEVYPHTALVALFGLQVSLKYKAKAGRSLETRMRELARCARLIESLSSADPPMEVRSAERWWELEEEMAGAGTGAALDRVEDELDAYVCAYTGLYYWAHGPARCRVVGDTLTGYIVTPVSEEQGRCLDLWRTPR